MRKLNKKVMALSALLFASTLALAGCDKEVPLLDFTATIKTVSGETKTFDFKENKEGKPVLPEEAISFMEANKYFEVSPETAKADTKYKFVGSWNYDLKNEDIEITLTKGEGTAEKPFLVDTNTFTSLVNLANDSITKEETVDPDTEKTYIKKTVKAAYNYKFIEDIDLTATKYVAKEESNYNLLATFSGVIDGDGHKFYNIDSDNLAGNYGFILPLIEGDTTYKNLTIELDNEFIGISWFNRNGNLTFDNITANTKDENKIIEMSGNSSPFLSQSFGAKLTFKNITNNVNCTGNGYFGAFLGGYYKGAGELTFENCVNNGNVFTTDEYGLCVGNGTGFNASKVNMTNVVNNGDISATKISLFATKALPKDKVEEAAEYASKVTNKGTLTTLNNIKATAKLVDNKITITRTDDKKFSGDVTVDYYSYASGRGTFRMDHIITKNIAEETNTFDVDSLRFVNLTDYKAAHEGEEVELIESSVSHYRYAVVGNYYIVDETSTGGFGFAELSKAQSVTIVITTNLGTDHVEVATLKVTIPAIVLE